MTDINYLLLLIGRKPLKGAVKCSNVDELYSEVVKKHADQFKSDGIKVHAGELTAYSVLSNDYDDYSAGRRQFIPDTLNPLRPAKKLTNEECIVLIGSAAEVVAIASSTSNAMQQFNSWLIPKLNQERDTNTPDHRVLRALRRHFANHISLCTDSDSAWELYLIGESFLGTDTKKNIVSENANITVNGTFGNHQFSESSMFYVGYLDTYKPIILKFAINTDSDTTASHEFGIFTSVAKENRKNLVPVELVRFSHLPTRHKQHTALQMPIYIQTLMSCPRDPRLIGLWLRAGRAVRDALHALHFVHICHLDVKPSNIFVDTDGECFLGDYDSACKLNFQSSSLVTRTTDIFLPQEFAVLHSQRKLTASFSVDFGMLVCSLVHVCDPTIPGSPSISFIEKWLNNLDESHSNWSDFKILLKDLINKTKLDQQQYTEGLRLIESRSVPTKLTAVSSDTEYPSWEPLV